MTHRLLLGSGALLGAVAQSLDEQPGSLQIATTDESLADSLRDQSIAVEQFETIDTETVGRLDSPGVVGVFEESRAQSRRLADAVHDAFPETRLVVYGGWTAGTETETTSATRNHDGEDRRREDLATTAAQVIDPGKALVEHISGRISESGRRMRQLQRILRGIDNLAVITHDNPDPDAIASGIALAYLARRAGCQAEVCYYGEITHQENRAFVNVLDLELRNIEPDETLSEFDGIALVDHSRPGVNDQLPSERSVDIVIDHHPPRSPVDATFVDLRSNVGATSTLLVEYLDRFNCPLDEELATALLFGIHVDTKGFSREISQQDFTAGARLVRTANFGMLERIESPSINPQTFETIAEAITHRRIEGTTLLSCVGELSERDALAQAADQLLTLEDISVVLVYGIKGGEIFISARARGTEIDLGEVLREAFGQIGSAGGHVDMAGAQIKLGVLEAVEDRDESLREIVEDVVSSRFLDVLATEPGPLLDDRYPTEAELDAEYLADPGSTRSESEKQTDGPDEDADTV